MRTREEILRDLPRKGSVQTKPMLEEIIIEVLLDIRKLLNVPRPSEYCYGCTSKLFTGEGVSNWELVDGDPYCHGCARAKRELKNA